MDAIAFLDDEDSSSSVTTSTVRQGLGTSSSSTAPLPSVTEAKSPLDTPDAASLRRQSSGSSSKVATVAMATSGGSSSQPITATLHIIPNISDLSDVESIVDNNHPSIDNSNLIPDMDDLYLNNLDRGNSKGTQGDDDNKYLIPDMPDLHYSPKKDKGDDLSPLPANSSYLKHRQVPGQEPRRDNLPDVSTMSRSESMSSLASERSGVSTYTSGVRDGKRSRTGGKRRRESLKPRIKAKFADNTLQYIKDRLEGRLFSGWLEERQRLETVVRPAKAAPPTGAGPGPTGADELVSGWRDVVEVDDCEMEMIRQLDAVMVSVPGSRDGKKWINIKAPGSVQGYLLWLMPEGEPRPPGHYWFRVQCVSCHPTLGLLLNLTVLRSIGTRDAETAEARNRRLAAAAAAAEGDLPLGAWLAWQHLYQSTREVCTPHALGQWAAVLLQPSNVAYGIKVLVMAAVSVVLGTVHACREAVRLFLLLMRESGMLIDRATPLVQILVNFVEKIFGGFFLLIAMVYKDVRKPASGGVGQPPAPQQHVYPIMAGNEGGVPSYGAARRYVGPDAWDHRSPR